MNFDVRSLLFVTATTTGLVGAFLLLYRRYQKTFDGFSQWGLGTLALSAGHFLVLGREYSLPLGVSIVLSNGAVALGAVLRLDGALRFGASRALPRWALFLVPVAMMSVCALFYFVHDSIAARSVITMLLAIGVCAAIAWIFLVRVRPRSSVYVMFALLHVGYAIVLLGRSLMWLAHPGAGLLDAGPMHFLLFGTASTIEVGIGMSYFLMHGHRLELDWAQVTQELRNALAELRESTSRIKVLDGLLPICMHCKNVRDDKGYWHRVEAYVTANSQAAFSHGICPECLSTRYPENGPPEPVD